MIDKARAAIKGTLGDYLYGECPMDRSLLRALGISYKDFTAIVRESGDDDNKVLELLKQRCGAIFELARAWSDRIAHSYRVFRFLLDVDDGYTVALRPFRGLIRFVSSLFARYVRYRAPAGASLIGLEIEAEHAGIKAERARGADEEPYRWLTPQNLDYTWKILVSVVLIFVMLHAIVQFIERIGGIFIVIVGAVFFAYLVYPIVRWLNERLPLTYAILIVYAAIAALVALGLMYLIPSVSAQVATLTRDWPSIQARITTYLSNPHNELLAHLPPFLRDQIVNLPVEIPRWLQAHRASAVGNAFMILVGTAAVIGTCIVIPILSAYLLNDSETIKRFFMGFIPHRHRESTLQLLSELETVIGGFVRGQLLVGASVGTLLAIGLSLVGEPYAILIGILGGALDFIPYVGPIIASIPAIIIAFVAGGVPLALKAGLVFFLANQAEGHLIAPNIVSRTIQLTPSAVVIAILIGGDLYGIPGIFIAVPVAGVIRVVLLHIIPGSVSREEAKPVLTKEPHESVEEAAAS